MRLEDRCLGFCSLPFGSAGIGFGSGGAVCLGASRSCCFRVVYLVTGCSAIIPATVS